MVYEIASVWDVGMCYVIELSHHNRPPPKYSPWTDFGRNFVKNGPNFAAKIGPGGPVLGPPLPKMVPHSNALSDMQ